MTDRRRVRYQSLTPVQSRLVEDALPWVEGCISRFLLRLPAHADTAAIRGAAMEGLTKAATRFDAQRGVTFKTHAWPRMWGAMLDECRALDPNKRSERAKGRTFATVSLDAPFTGTERDARALFDTFTLGGDFTDRVCARLDLLAALNRLPPRERRVMFARLAGITQREIGAMFGVTEARICQIQTKATKRIVDEGRLAA